MCAWFEKKRDLPQLSDKKYWLLPINLITDKIKMRKLSWKHSDVLKVF